MLIFTFGAETDNRVRESERVDDVADLGGQAEQRGELLVALGAVVQVSNARGI